MRTQFFQSVCTATAFAMISACSADTGKPKPPSNPTPITDAEPNQMDTGSIDTGMMSSVDTGMMGNTDTGIPLSAACMELSGCCGQIPAGQYRQQCLDQVAANVDSGCRSTLMTIQGFGICLPPDHDAGMRGDVGPLGPKCERLLTCCAEIPVAFLRTQCENAAMDGVEMACETRLGQAQQAGICLDPPDSGITDAGTSTTSMDAGTSTTSMDAGTSTTGMDAGTSTVSDGG